MQRLTEGPILSLLTEVVQATLSVIMCHKVHLWNLASQEHQH